MKQATRIAKAKAVYLRSVWEIVQCESIVKLSWRSGIDKEAIIACLMKHDPELLVQLNGHIPDYLDLSFTPAQLAAVDLSRETGKMRLFVQAIKEGYTSKQAIADRIRVNRRTVYRLLERLGKLVDVIRED